MRHPEAAGHRRNRRGDATRRAMLETALEILATGDNRAASVNNIARQAGASWGAVAYQFGDVDGFWAAVLDFIAERRGDISFASDHSAPLASRVAQIVGALRVGLAVPDAIAIDTLRAELPRERGELEDRFPQTAAAIAAWEISWTGAIHRAFEDLPIPAEKVRGIAALIPGAMRGLTSESRLGTYSDIDAALSVLTAALTSYLSEPGTTEVAPLVGRRLPAGDSGKDRP